MFAEADTLLGIATLLFGFLGTVFAGVMTYLIARLKTGQVEAAQKVDEVKTKLEETTASQGHTLEGIAATGKQTHALVNSASLIQMRLYAKLARRMADKTGAPEDIETAEAAEKLLLSHEIQAEKLDQTGKG